MQLRVSHLHPAFLLIEPKIKSSSPLETHQSLAYGGFDREFDFASRDVDLLSGHSLSLGPSFSRMPLGSSLVESSTVRLVDAQDKVDLGSVRV